MGTALVDERIGAASPWMVSVLKAGAAAARATKPKPIRSILIKEMMIFFCLQEDGNVQYEV